nr:immunoglobulin light chain junction region [Macaca mulatta]MOX24069.1 immunoglobulin light chain junction region [Macaca mulatta]MOX24896.1 immunoglobulin light chain junction region [Macaca mulatta]MOX25200.1 immunoglobulin light chain junction region [Macaca mulatta]MOX25231.1 immunoglobulin light chain junction region [Macaca mulatta]
CQQYSTYPYSF